jgi:hypothetical protein
MSDYSKCVKSGHKWVIVEYQGDFTDFEAYFECKKCEAVVHAGGDIRHKDGRHIDWLQ